MVHILFMTPQCLWWVSHGLQREVVEICTWGEAHTGRAEKELADAQLSVSALPCFHAWAVGDRGRGVRSPGAESEAQGKAPADCP